MRINQFVARATGLSRRAADAAVEAGQVKVNGTPAEAGQAVGPTDTVLYDGQQLHHMPTTTIMLNKPVGYVCSRNGQGNKTVYDLLPAEFHHLKPVGRLDKDSSGLLLLTSDGQLANQLTHPKYQKTKVYQVELDRPLTPADQQQITQGLQLEDGLSRLNLTGQDIRWTVTMTEGRNRQIRRTFQAQGYTVTKLHRTKFGPYSLNELASGKFTEIVVK